MRQLTSSRPGSSSGARPPSRARGRRRGDRAAAGGRDLRPRPADRRGAPRSRGRSPSATSASPRWSRSATRSVGRARGPGQRPLPDLLRRVRALPPRAHAATARRAAAGDVRAAARARLRRLPRPTPSGSRSPTRCWCRCPTASSRRPSPASPTTSPTPGARSRRSSRRGRAPPVLICGGAGSIASTRPRSPSRSAPSGSTSPAGARQRRASSPSGSARTSSTRSSPSGSAPTRSPSTPAANHDGLAARCARPSPRDLHQHRHLLRARDAGAAARDVHEGITFHTGRVHARPAMAPVLELVREGRFEPEPSRADRAWEDAAEAVAGHRGKLVICR